MIPVDPTSLSRGDTVYVRNLLNAGSGEPPKYGFKEGKVVEYTKHVVHVVFTGKRRKNAIRPKDVYWEEELTNPRKAQKELLKDDLITMVQVFDTQPPPPLEKGEVLEIAKISEPKAELAPIPEEVEEDDGLGLSIENPRELAQARIEVVLDLLAQCDEAIPPIEEKLVELAEQLEGLQQAKQELKEEHATLLSQLSGD